MTTTLAITGEMTPQMIKTLKEQISKLSPKLKVETIKEIDIPTKETKYEITEADRADMREILAQRERGELKYVGIEEIDDYVKAIITKREVNENKLHA
ncbi:hypothetical protein [Campylobacter fetus]|uniref:hypothetical protein n=1 Tax=Campylobacter fetus TaxID=196 RepID=UPI0018E903B6|nr:hypothetical protein [Campylobacter fetus]